MTNCRPWLVALATALVACQGEEEGRYPDSVGEEYECEATDYNGLVLPLGLANYGLFYTCPSPTPNASGPRFTDTDSSLYVVSGGSARINLAFDGLDSLQGHNIIIDNPAEYGYLVAPAPSGPSPISAELYVRSAFLPPGRTVVYNINIGIDDGTGTPEQPSVGAWMSAPVTVYGVGTGDIQISLNWQTNTDLDLHVVDPNGEEIYFANQTAASGGTLDLDSYAACHGDHKYNENIFWGEGQAPAGEYVVSVHLWSECNTFAQDIETPWRVTIVPAGATPIIREGVFSATLTAPGAEMVEVARFTF